MPASSFQFSGFLLRLAFALVLVFLSYNPSGYSFVHWIGSDFLALPVLVLVGIVLLIGWVIFLRATLRSLGPIGIILAVLFFGCIAWVAIYYNLMAVGSTVFIYIVLVIVSAILSLGMSWSHVRRRMSGQVDMDDLDQ